MVERVIMLVLSLLTSLSEQKRRSAGIGVNITLVTNIAIIILPEAYCRYLLLRARLPLSLSLLRLSLMSARHIIILREMATLLLRLLSPGAFCYFSHAMVRADIITPADTPTHHFIITRHRAATHFRQSAYVIRASASICHDMRVCRALRA